MFMAPILGKCIGKIFFSGKEWSLAKRENLRHYFEPLKMGTIEFMCTMIRYAIYETGPSRDVVTKFEGYEFVDSKFLRTVLRSALSYIADGWQSYLSITLMSRRFFPTMYSLASRIVFGRKQYCTPVGRSLNTIHAKKSRGQTATIHAISKRS